MADHHDRLFKDLLSNREFAVTFLQQYLPPKLATQVDWGTVRLDAANVEHTRQQHKANTKQKEQSDLNFIFQFTDGRFGACLVHIEFQTTHDMTLMIRTRHYQTSYLLDFIKRNKGVKKLPLVVSIIYYANKKPFSHSLDIHTYFQDVELARKYAFTTQFIELSMLSDEQLLQHGHIAGLECILKHVTEQDVEGHIAVISRAITAYDSLVRQTLIKYLARQTSPEFPAKIVDKEPTLEVDMKTAAQQWMQEGAEKLKPTFIKQGIERGIERGIEQGIEQGIERGIRRVATKMLADGDSIENIARVTGLSTANIQAIKVSQY